MKMEILNYSKTLRLEDVATATVGMFDGVHRGHRYVLGQLANEARGWQTLTTVITFDRHPFSVIPRKRCPPLLTTLDERLRLLSFTGVHRCVVLPFTKEMAGMSARDFMLLMRDQLGVRSLLLGYDNRFGHDRYLTFKDYVRYGNEIGMEVRAIRPVTLQEDGQPVSSSSVRRLLEDGRLELAYRYLGHPYCLGGVVVDGEHIGRQIGFPTANLQPDADKLVPKAGVYAVWVRVGKEKTPRPAMMNIGQCPTFGHHQTTLEVHLFDYTGDLYGQTLYVGFVRRLRDEQCFSDASVLAQQLEADRTAALKALYRVKNL